MKLKYLALFILSFILISGTIDLDNLFDYDSQTIPNYINKDNTPIDNAISDAGATLGRVLFYDSRLSANNTIACASCHQQEFAFSDTEQLSIGLNGGLTGRHAMRLVNSRFGDEVQFFWDERAPTLEAQTTQPIQDHIEMGFSGADGDPGIDSLITKLSEIEDYQRLFEFVYGDATITEERMQESMAQFIRSIQSFDSKFDAGLAMVNNINANFPNFTAEENQGKTLFITPPTAPTPGAGCQGCHRAPEFDIDPNSLNNGVIGVANDPTLVDLTNTRAPSLRDLVNPAGQLNGPLMHDGSFNSIMDVINHYDNVPFDPMVNTNLDNRLITPPGGPGMPPQGQNLNLTEAEKQALEAFLLTLTGSDIYTNDMYSNPFDPDGSLELLPLIITCNPPETYDVEVPTATSATFTWDAVPDATFYQVKYRIKGTTDWLTQGTTNLQRTISGLTTKKYYQYKLRSQCSDDSWSDFTDIGLFYTSTCDVPTGLASVYLDNTRMRVRWDVNTDEIKGKIRYREVGGTDWTTQNSADGNNYLYVNDLPADAVIQYRVRSNCDGNDWSAYSDSYYHDLSTGARLAQSTSIDDVKLYPNPAKEILHIELSEIGETRISISDVSGQLVLSQNVNATEEGQTETLDISRLVKGYHILTIQTNAGIISKKFVVVK